MQLSQTTGAAFAVLVSESHAVHWRQSMQTEQRLRGSYPRRILALSLAATRWNCCLCRRQLRRCTVMKHTQTSSAATCVTAAGVVRLQVGFLSHVHELSR